jgi:hypothetical protein
MTGKERWKVRVGRRLGDKPSRNIREVGIKQNLSE